MISMLVVPLLACILLVGIHVYFGSFVLKRGILFIDLALAQWAALGYLVGHWLGIHAPLLLVLTGFGFTMIAAFIITVATPIYQKVNLKEAVIGVLYIAAIAIATSIISSTGMEGHHLTEMLSGHLLFVQPKELLYTVLLYGAIACLAWRCHSYFMSAHSRWWEWVFYVLFGAVVTSSVKMVGILLVFAYLVIPILSIRLITTRLSQQLWYGWCVGVIGSLMGLGMSLWWDIPPSTGIVLALCGCWVMGLLVSRRVQLK